MRTLVVTGAGGYIGRHLLAAGKAAGWRVIAATRNPVTGADAWLRYRLEDAIAPDAIPHDAILVHLAAQTGDALDADVELRAADRLIEVASRHGTRLVFVSSQTARPDAPTRYGRSKWAIEQRVVAAGGVAVRPGLVYGGSPGGVYASLLRLLREHAVLPSLVPAPKVQPVHVDDLAQALLHAGTHAEPGSVVRVAAAEPMALDGFLRALANGQGRARLRFIPFPALMVPIGALLLDILGARTLAMRMRSLVDLPRMDADGVATTGVALRSLAQGVSRRHPERRALAAEGAALLRYMLGRAPQLAMLRRYIRCVEQRQARALSLPMIALAWPPALRALDHRRWLGRFPELDWRLSAAFAIAEASPDGASRVLRLSRQASAPNVLLRLAAVGVLEGIARIVGWPLRACTRREPDV